MVTILTSRLLQEVGVERKEVNETVTVARVFWKGISFDAERFAVVNVLDRNVNWKTVLGESPKTVHGVSWIYSDRRDYSETERFSVLTTVSGNVVAVVEGMVTSSDTRARILSGNSGEACLVRGSVGFGLTATTKDSTAIENRGWIYCGMMGIHTIMGCVMVDGQENTEVVDLFAIYDVDVNVRYIFVLWS